jgi:hypothetical protein
VIHGDLNALIGKEHTPHQILTQLSGSDIEEGGECRKQKKRKKVSIARGRRGRYSNKSGKTTKEDQTQKEKMENIAKKAGIKK